MPVVSVHFGSPTCKSEQGPDNDTDIITHLLEVLDQPKFRTDT